MPNSRSEQIFEHARRLATPLRTTLGHTWAIVPEGSGRYRGYPVTSRDFRDWLAHSFHTEHSIYPGTSALESAVRMFAAHARYSEFPVSDVFTRVGCRGDRRLPQAVLIHLANSNNELVEITPQDHRILGSESWHFLAGAGTLPLPRPMANSTTLLQHLRALLSLDGMALERIVVWLCAALRPSAPYPVLILSGPPGSGKSMLARMLRHLIDPSAIPLLMPPSNERDLLTLALHNYVLAFDDAAALPRAILDSLGRMATGAGLGICGRHIFDSPAPLPLARPLILTVPAGHRAAINNSIRVELTAIEPERARTETFLAQQHQAAAPAILGTLCAAVAAALSNTAEFSAAPVSRFADAHQWAIGAAPVLGLTREQINRALAANALIDALTMLLEIQPEWTGTASDLFEIFQLRGFPGLAGNARHLSEQLNMAPLALFGIALEHTHDGTQRMIHLTQSSASCVRKGYAGGLSSLQ